MSARAIIGDIFEIQTEAGCAYAQYTHKHQMYGALLRVSRGLYKTLPTDFCALIQPPPILITFFPLGAALNRNIVRKIAHCPIPSHSSAFPTFKAGTPNKEGTVENWWLWDGEREWRPSRLSKTELTYPTRGVVNDTMLISLILKSNVNTSESIAKNKHD